MKDRKLLGALGEQMAASLLYAQGLDILEHNYRCKLGEVDIIAGNEEEIVFIEVKTRMEPVMGDPAMAVDRVKRNRIRKAAEYYMMTHRIDDRWVSFQVMEITVNQIENAF